MSEKLSVFTWNVRGLNAPACREAVRSMIQSVNQKLVCLQETKLSHISPQLATETLGSRFNEFRFQPANGTRGGIMLEWNSEYIQATDLRIERFTLSMISLIHSFAKLVSKVLAMQLAPHINDLVSHAQSTFIRRRCILENYLYVRNLARAYHRNKTPALLMKLDISKAFDCVSWEYLLDLLQHCGFPARWRNWLSLLLSSSSSSVRLNGVRGPWTATG
jgi:exonuclease III